MIGVMAARGGVALGFGVDVKVGDGVTVVGGGGGGGGGGGLVGVYVGVGVGSRSTMPAVAFHPWPSSAMMVCPPGSVHASGTCADA
jgi:hypothetical protein